MKKMISDMAFLVCEFGSTMGFLTATNHGSISMGDEFQGTEQDILPGENIPLFGTCSSQGGACTYTPASGWSPVMSSASGGGCGFLSEESKLCCAFGEISAYPSVGAVATALGDNPDIAIDLAARMEAQCDMDWMAASAFWQSDADMAALLESGNSFSLGELAVDSPYLREAVRQSGGAMDFGPVHQSESWDPAAREKVALDMVSEMGLSPFDAIDNVTMMQVLGANLEELTDKESIAEIVDFLSEMPADLQDLLIAEGRTYGFSTSKNLFQVGPSLANFKIERTLAGETSLSGVRTGKDFLQTQILSIEAELALKETLTLGGLSKKQVLYRWYEFLGVGPKLNPRLAKILKGPGLDLELAAYQGAGFNYEAVVTPEQARKIANGEVLPPDIFSPMDLEPGNSLFIDGNAFEGAKASGIFRKWGLGGSYDHRNIKGAGLGIQRLDGEKVQLLAGSYSAVERVTGLGYSFLQVGKERSLTDESLHLAVLDLSTEEGQQTYRQFVMTASLPEMGDDGVLRTGEMDVFEYNSDTYVRAGIGPATVDWHVGSSGSEMVVTNYDDGEQVVKQTSHLNNRSVDYSVVVDDNGDVIKDQTGVSVVFADLPPARVANALNAQTPDFDRLPPEQNQHVQVSMTADELNALRERAANAGPGGGSFVTALAATESAHDAAKLMQQWHSDDLLTELDFLAKKDGGLPVSVEVKDVETFDENED